MALAEAQSVDAGLAMLDRLAQDLHTCQHDHAARADLLARNGAWPDALAAYSRATARPTNPADADS